MKVEVIQEKFATALTHVNKAVNTKPNIPVLANVLLESEKGKLKLSSTNLEIGIASSIGADIAQEGKVTVSARLLSEFVNSLKPGKIEVSLEGQKLVVKSTDNSAEFYVIPAEEFPVLPVAEGKPLIEINAIDFAKALEKTCFAASTDNSRPVLTGLLTRITQRKLTLVGVDGFRLSQKVIDISDKKNETEFKEIIPAKSLLELAKIIRDIASDKDNVEIYTIESNNQVIFKVGDVSLATRLIEGEFPPYEDILPKDRQYGFQVLKPELANGIKIVSIFARNVVGNKTRFTVDADKGVLRLNAVVIDVGNNESVVDISEVIGEKVETAYNVRFLQDMINAIEGDVIIYESNGVTAPGVFKDKDDPDFLHVIMPMRLE